MSTCTCRSSLSLTPVALITKIDTELLECPHRDLALILHICELLNDLLLIHLSLLLNPLPLHYQMELLLLDPGCPLIILLDPCNNELLLVFLLFIDLLDIFDPFESF